MVFYRQSECYQPFYQPSYQPYYQPCYEPCYPPQGYGRPVGYSPGFSCYDPCSPHGGYGYNFGSGGYAPQGLSGYGCGSRYGSSSLQPCSYGYRYTNRGGCYNPRSYRCGYGARRIFPSRRYNGGYYGLW